MIHDDEAEKAGADNQSFRHVPPGRLGVVVKGRVFERTFKHLNRDLRDIAERLRMLSASHDHRAFAHKAGREREGK
jgi:hypothetical protein